MTITYNGNTHQYAMFFAPLEDEALTALADDIKANGLINPITITPDGDLLDGRNRLAACELAGVDPTFVVVDTDAAAFVLSSNDRRRHASTGARAASVALVLNAEGKRKNYRWERGSVPDARDNRRSSDSGWEKAMQQAGTVLDRMPELLPEVAAGRISLDAAYTSADKLRQAEQLAESQRVKKLEDDLAHADGLLADVLTHLSYLLLTEVDQVKESTDLLGWKDIAKHVPTVTAILNQLKEHADDNA